MSNDAFGKLCALLAAFVWACAVPLLQRAGKGLHPVSSCVIRNLCGVFFLCLFLLPQGYSIVHEYQKLALSTHLWFLASGIIGISLADTFFFIGARSLQVGVIGLTQTIYSPLVVIISAFFLQEQLNFSQLLGGGLVIAATILVKLSFLFEEKTPGKNESKGFFFMILCVLCNVLSILLLKISVKDFPVPLLMPYRNLIGVFPLLLWLGAQKKDSLVKRELSDISLWKKFLLGSLMGSALSSTLWVLGFAYTKASIAALLNESSALFMLGIGFVAFGERLSLMKLLSAMLATIGLCLLWL